MSINRDLPAVSDEVRERCRFRHMWDQVDSNHWTATHGDPLTLRCMRCGTEFRAQISSAGVYVKRRYVYPPGYIYTKSDLRLTPASRRALLVHAAIINARKQRLIAAATTTMTGATQAS